MTFPPRIAVGLRVLVGRGRLAGVATLLLVFIQTEPASTQIVLRDVAMEAGLSFQHERGARGDWHPVETMGSGLAVLDYDGDGAADLFFVQGGEVPGTGGPPGLVGALYRNEGDGRFRMSASPPGSGFRPPPRDSGWVRWPPITTTMGTPTCW